MVVMTTWRRDRCAGRRLDDVGVSDGWRCRRVKFWNSRRFGRRVVAIDEEEDAFGAGVADEAMGEGAGGEGLPAPVAIWMRSGGGLRRGRFRDG